MMERKMLVIGGSWDGQRVEWDDLEPMMRVDTKGPREVTARVEDSPQGIVPFREIPEERYHVKMLVLGDGPVWFLTAPKSRGLGLTMDVGDIFHALMRGYRKPYACPACKQTPNRCAYCGYQ